MNFIKKTVFFFVLVCTVLSAPFVLYAADWEQFGGEVVPGAAAVSPTLTFFSNGIIIDPTDNLPIIIVDKSSTETQMGMPLTEYFVRKFNGTSWETLGATFKSVVVLREIEVSSSGVPFLLFGELDDSDPDTMRMLYSVKKFNGSSWEQVGPSFGLDITINDLVLDTTGIPYVFHNDTDNDGATSKVFKFNAGTNSWEQVGDALPGEGNSIMFNENNELFFAHLERGDSSNLIIEKLNGTAWGAHTSILLPGGGLTSRLSAVMVDNQIHVRSASVIGKVLNMQIFDGVDWSTYSTAPSSIELGTLRWVVGPDGTSYGIYNDESYVVYLAEFTGTSFEITTLPLLDYEAGVYGDIAFTDDGKTYYIFTGANLSSDPLIYPPTVLRTPISSTPPTPGGPTTPSATTRKVVGGIQYGCKDQTALNYNYFSSHRQELCQYVPTARTIPVAQEVGVKHTFLTNLSMGMQSPDVRLLQQFLNAKGFTITQAGAGSVGNETTYFGSLTKAALAKFQAANKITPAIGFFGPVTRGVVNAL